MTNESWMATTVAASHSGDDLASSRLPRVSLGVPVHNGEDYLDACLASLASQTLEEIEIIICDNASTDRTPQIVEEHTRRDPRIRYYRAEHNRGAAHNFNWSFSLARGEYFKWCAADDVVLPTFLERCIEALENDPTSVLAYTGTLDIDSEGRVIGEIHDNRWQLRFDSESPEFRVLDLITANHSHIAVFGLIRASALRKSNLIGSFAASDRALLVELALKGRFARIPDNLLLHREHAGRFTRRFKSEQERQQWYNPSRRRLSLPHWRLLGEFSRAILVSNLPAQSKLACGLSVARWIKWGAAGMLLDDLQQFLRDWPVRA